MVETSVDAAQTLIDQQWMQRALQLAERAERDFDEIPVGALLIDAGGTVLGEGWSFEVERFNRWLNAMGGDGEIRRVRKMTFGASWASSDQEDVDYWEGKKGDVNVSIFEGKVTVGGSGNIVESPAAPLLKQVDELITTLLTGKKMGEGLGYAEWMLVWAEIQDLTTKGWDQVGSFQ